MSHVWYICVLVSLWFIPTAGAEVLDRILAVVEGHIITLSDLRQEREIRTQLGEKPIDDDQALAKELVDEYLIQRQIADYPNIVVTDAEVDAAVQKLGLFQVSAPAVTPNPTGRVLADATGRILEVSPSSLSAAVRNRIRMQKFFDVRFRQLIRPTEDQIRKYYEEVFAPAARARGLQSILPLTDTAMVAAIRENIIQESLDHDVEGWLEAISRRSNVEVFQ